MGIDAAGDLFSLLAVFFQPELDILGLVIYATELVLWIGVMLCGVWYNLLPLMRQRQRETESSNTDGNSAEGEAQASIALHRLGSSTSVFRTPSGLITARPLTTST